VKRWSVALAWISLALAGIAQAEPARPVELPTSVPVEIALPGLEQAVAADPSIVRADADTRRGVLTLTGLLLNRRSVVYAWTSAGMTVFIADVVAAPLPPTPDHIKNLVPGRLASFYRVSVGGGFRRTAEGTQRLPLSFGSSAARPAGPGRLTMRSESRPFAQDNAGEAPTGTGVMQWAGDRGRIAVGDQPVDLGQRLLTTFPLRGVTAEAKLGAATVGAFGGTRATPALALMPEDDDPLPALLGGLYGSWTPHKELRAFATAALAGTSPVADAGVEWRRGPWTLGIEAAGTPERLAAGLRIRREGEVVTIEQRLTERTAGESPLLTGVAGLSSETVASWRILPKLALTGGLSVLPPLGRADWRGGWRVGTDYSGLAGARVAVGYDRAFDGSVTTMSAGVDAQSRLLGNATLTVSRTVQESPTGSSVLWHEAARIERPVELGIVRKLFAEEVVSIVETGGALSLSAGAEVEVGWLRASVAPGVVVPTLTDPNALAPTLRLRLSVAPSPSFQIHADVRQTWGDRPDLTVQVGVTVGFGSGTPWRSMTSWFRRSAIEGIVFVDTNGNGRPDPDEPGLPGVRVQLDGGRSAVTDTDGRYRFTGLRDGSYAVGLDRASLPADLRLASASPVQVTLPGEATQVAFAFAGAGAIHGVVFNDVGLAGRFTGVEPGVAANLVLEGPGTRRSLSVAGAFSLSGLTPGRYRLTLDALSLPPAYVLKAPAVEVEIGPGGVVSAQFPVLALRALAVAACLTRNGGHGCEPSDTPAAGLKLLVGATPVTTDATGRALVRELPAGPITLTVDPASVPAGWVAPERLTVELPETPTTLPVFIRLTPARR